MSRRAVLSVTRTVVAFPAAAPAALARRIHHPDVRAQRRVGKRWKAQRGLRRVITVPPGTTSADVRVPKRARGTYRVRAAAGTRTAFARFTVR